MHANLNQSAQVQSFYIEHNSWLNKWLARKLGSSFDAADLAHETFIRLMSKSELVLVEEPRAYLTKIAHGLMVNHLRRRDIENAYTSAMHELGAGQEQFLDCTATRLILLEKLIEIDTMLAGLPVKVRTAFLLHKLDGLGYAEIASDMGMSVISIKKYIARALVHCASAR